MESCKTTREQALDWFRSLETNTKFSKICQWKNMTEHFAKTWTVSMIESSSSIIERIYRELEMEENF